MDNTIDNKKGVQALAVVGANIKLDDLEADTVKRGAPGCYVHDCFVYKEGYNRKKKCLKGQATIIGREQRIALHPSNP